MYDIFQASQEVFQALQKQVCEQMEAMERDEVEKLKQTSSAAQDTLPETFLIDKWTSFLGSGSTCILQNGMLWEKAGVSFSSIKSASLPPAATLRNPEMSGKPYSACGISIVVHPKNPYVPTSHCNLRIFVMNDKQGYSPNSDTEHEKKWWFGGGFDLTPYYVDQEVFDQWHTAAKEICNKFDTQIYPKLKKQCDDYFFLPHRGEARGVGGLFFDDFNLWDEARCLDFVKQLGECYKNTYLQIADNRKDNAYGERERNFQLYRRGRYVEFNLLQDRGTLFGIQSGGRTESILMSLPPKVSWQYNAEFAADSPEAQLQKFLLRPQ